MPDFTPGPWTAAKSWVIANEPSKGGLQGSDAIDYYGGFLVAESCAPADAIFIAAAPRMYAALWRVESRMAVYASYRDGSSTQPGDQKKAECALQELRDAIAQALRRIEVSA